MVTGRALLQWIGGPLLLETGSSRKLCKLSELRPSILHPVENIAGCKRHDCSRCIESYAITWGDAAALACSIARMSTRSASLGQARATVVARRKAGQRLRCPLIGPKLLQAAEAGP